MLPEHAEDVVPKIGWYTRQIHVLDELWGRQVSALLWRGRRSANFQLDEMWTSPSAPESSEASHWGETASPRLPSSKGESTLGASLNSTELVVSPMGGCPCRRSGSPGLGIREVMGREVRY